MMITEVLSRSEVAVRVSVGRELTFGRRSVRRTLIPSRRWRMGIVDCRPFSSRLTRCAAVMRSRIQRLRSSRIRPCSHRCRRIRLMMMRRRNVGVRWRRRVSILRVGFSQLPSWSHVDVGAGSVRIRILVRLHVRSTRCTLAHRFPRISRTTRAFPSRFRDFRCGRYDGPGAILANALALAAIS